MGNAFHRLKRNMCIGAVIRALAGGLSLGVILVAAQWLYAKLTMAEPNFLRYALIGGIPALILSAGLLVLLLPRDKKLAAQLDDRLQLHEKVQTMIAFREEDGDMIRLQRESAEQALLESPRRRVHGALTGLFIALPIVACLALVGTLLVPAKEPAEPPPVVDTGWRLDDFQAQKLRDLIAYIQKSDMEEELKHGVSGELEGLLIKLGSIRKENVMRETVVDTIINIHGLVSDHNTYDLLAAAMVNTVSTPVKQLGNSLYSLKPLLISEQMTTLAQAVNAAEEGKAAAAGALATAVEQALSRADVPASDEVYEALAALASTLRNLTDDMSEDDVLSLLDAAETTLLSSLEIETVNETVGTYTITRLMEIFGIPADAVPPEVLTKVNEATTEGDYRPNDDQEQNAAGGIGSGEVLFGSNDTIYDPDKGAYVTYGEVLETYYAAVLEHMGDGTLPPELEDMFYDYFAMLANGTDQKED